MFKQSSIRRLFSKPVFMMTFKKTLPQGVLLLSLGALLPAYAIYMIADDQWPPGHIHLFCKDFLMGVSLLAPLFVFPAFSHLSSKRKSDLMESLPESRASFACSALLACLLWQVAIGLATLGTCLFAPLFIEDYTYPLLFATEKGLLSLLFSALCGLYVLALSFLAVSLCGRLEGAILTLIVLLSVPGMVVMSFEFVFSSATRAGELSPFFLIGVPFMRTFFSHGYALELHPLQLLPALLETGALFGAGFFIYTHRKSEKSGALTLYPALSRLLLSLLTLLPFFISLLFFSAEFSFHYTELPTLGSLLADMVDYMSRGGIYLYLFAASLAAFPVCALLIERKALGMVKALLTYALTVGATALWFVTLALIYCLWA